MLEVVESMAHVSCSRMQGGNRVLSIIVDSRDLSSKQLPSILVHCFASSGRDEQPSKWTW